MNHPPLVSRLVTDRNCSQLRHKGMYVFTEIEAEESLQGRDGLESTSYWCACTQKAFGPDGQPVSARSCTVDRGCCED